MVIFMYWKKVFSIAAKQIRKPKILIADNSKRNRTVLADIFSKEYEIIEAENGIQTVAGIQKYNTNLSLILMNIAMPEMNGFDILTFMNQHHWIDVIPVIIIAADIADADIERAYSLGASDFVSCPLHAAVVYKRAVNAILLYTERKKLVEVIADQVYKKEHQNNLIIDILSYVMDVKNGDSSRHVLHVRILTNMLLQSLIQKTNAYQLTQADISLISAASTLHDIGKIGISGEILNKPGKLTDDEFSIMKSHSAAGAQFLQDLPVDKNDPLVKAAIEICRWHHERYDGHGYPDGLKGDRIPISAQVVSLAEVYDDLTSARIYRPAYSHGQAIQMIVNGECGAFNPLLLDCLADIAEELPEKLNNPPAFQTSPQEMQTIAEEMLRGKETTSKQTLDLLEQERMKNSFYAVLTQEIQFEYTSMPPMLTVSSWGAGKLGLDEIIMDPVHNEKLGAVLDAADMQHFIETLHGTSPEHPMITYDCELCCGGQRRWFQITAMTLWSTGKHPQHIGLIGKAIDIHDTRMKLNALEQTASHDSLTGLLHHAHAKKMILERMASHPDSQFALAIVDIDHFKLVNDNFGHQFGDQVLIYIANNLQQSIRSSDIAARVGGEEFLIFLEYKKDLKPIIKRIFKSLAGVYDDCPVSVSMGISKTGDAAGYEELFHKADQALYTAKQSGRKQYRFYDNSMAEMLSNISPIETT